jgi:aminoglycoside phosphotransferase (APT) family kinase protein
VSGPEGNERVAQALIAHLRRALGAPALGFAEAPAPLAGAPDPFRGRLVLRLLPGADVGVRLEATLHDALLARAFPVPCVLAWGEGPDPFGRPFQILECVAGEPLVAVSEDGRGVDLRVASLRHWRRLLLGPWPEELAALHGRLHALDATSLGRELETAGFDPDILSLRHRLARLEARAVACGFDTLRPILSRLAELASALRERPVLCHGDLFPNQVLAEEDRTRGVVDWSDAVLAPAGLDVGVVKAGLETLDLLAGPVAPLAAAVVRRLTSRFVRAYRRLLPLAPESLQLGEAWRCASVLVSVVEGPGAGARRPGPYDTRGAVAALCRRLSELTSLPLDPERIPLPRPALETTWSLRHRQREAAPSPHAGGGT